MKQCVTAHACRGRVLIDLATRQEAPVALGIQDVNTIRREGLTGSLNVKNVTVIMTLCRFSRLVFRANTMGPELPTVSVQQ